MRLNPFKKTPTEAKESRAAPIMVMGTGSAVWSKRNYEAFAKEAYGQNVVANRAISSISEAVASLKPLAYRGEQELTNAPALDVMKRPNPKQSWRDFGEEFTAYYLIAGNAYVEKVYVGSELKEMYCLRPDRMSIVPAANGEPAAYEYRVGGRKVTFEPEAIAHFKSFNPTDDWYGLSNVEPGAYAIDQHTEAMKWMQALLQNSATPSGALVHNGESGLSDEAFSRLKSEMESQYQGAKNAGRPMLLEGGLDWKTMGLSPKDMMAIDTKNSAARDICLAFGVPPLLIGIAGDNTYANYAEARMAFWEDTVIPLADRIFAFMSEVTSGGDIEIKPDYDQVPAIVDKRKTLAEVMAKSDWLTDNEKREAMGYGPIEGGDKLRRNEPAPLPEIDDEMKSVIAGYGPPMLREVK